MNLDVFGLQEFRPDQAQYLRESLPEFAFIGEHYGETGQGAAGSGPTR